MAGRSKREARRWVGVALALAALGVLFALPISSSGPSSASAAYYYYSSGPVTLALAPPSATNALGTTHTVTATVMQDSTFLESVIVRFSVSGSVDVSTSCTTDGTGSCSITYSGPQFPGSDVISAYADLNGNTSPDAGEPTATATKTWVLPNSTPGKATGSGSIQVGGDVITFDFSAKSSGSAFSGSCTVNDHAQKRKIFCSDVTAFVESTNMATFYGHASDAGTATYYRITVVDNGSPGSADTFAITTANGYSASGTLTSGNLQVQ